MFRGACPRMRGLLNPILDRFTCTDMNKLIKWMALELCPSSSLEKNGLT